MLTEVIIKEFIAALFKNATIKKYTDPLIEKGIQKLSALFKKNKKEALQSTLTTSTLTPKQLASEHTAELDELLADQEFRDTVHEMITSPSIYASIAGVNVEVENDITLKLQNNKGTAAGINTSVVDSTFHSSSGGFNLEING